MWEEDWTIYYRLPEMNYMEQETDCCKYLTLITPDKY